MVDCDVYLGIARRLINAAEAALDREEFYACAYLSEEASKHFMAGAGVSCLVDVDLELKPHEIALTLQLGTLDQAFEDAKKMLYVNRGVFPSSGVMDVGDGQARLALDIAGKVGALFGGSGLASESD